MGRVLMQMNIETITSDQVTANLVAGWAKTPFP